MKLACLTYHQEINKRANPGIKAYVELDTKQSINDAPGKNTKSRDTTLRSEIFCLHKIYR